MWILLHLKFNKVPRVTLPLVLGHVPAPRRIPAAKRMQCFDWPGLVMCFLGVTGEWMSGQESHSDCGFERGKSEYLGAWCFPQALCLSWIEILPEGMPFKNSYEGNLQAHICPGRIPQIRDCYQGEKRGRIMLRDREKLQCPLYCPFLGKYLLHIVWSVPNAFMTPHCL